ncbi:Phage major tail protein 2 [Gemmata obscuriglobus]|uniref:Phage major tail protein, TP901-1 family n=1 Tax=Gemmata obscuriglobus TaxID=114 RepID=A0A2Z3GUQ5_9BACT|nr:phage major tail protein, TP901-1 family [Gemmata obscuriglobus]AWM37018.1 phage major tail protein, TP901-1 family [Gemmata obscuriglobus]QEG30277.1 Phage major tail protein 2 [Gemmata obscuriglobus]VTS09601.1 Putative secreted protein OS=Rickettsiales bacterium Ac37b GN=NOVO_00405 PE=4 SV=1: Phage_tail_2 [Gemmata obscuriglobus UQM 2246]
MAAQRGRLMLLKIGTAAAGTLLGGLKSTTLTMNNSVIDVSTKDTLGWRELLEDGSLKFFSIACDGIFKDSTTDETIRGYVFANTLNTFTFVFPNGDTIEGTFQVTNYQRAGAVEGVETYSMTLESSGIPVFTAA